MITAAVLLFLAPPPSFTKAVQQIAAATNMHVVDWWSDDLDNDKTPESIATLCNDNRGLYVVQKGTQMLSAPMNVDGRNSCPEGTDAPKWHVEHSGTIGQSVNVHHGHTEYQVAIREGRLAVVGEHDSGFDVDRTGRSEEDNERDYDALTFKHSTTTPAGKATAKTGSLVVITERAKRPTSLRGGAVVLSATRTKDVITLHVHADKALVLEDCNEKPCKAMPVAKGDSDHVVEAPNELDLVGGGATVHLLFDNIPEADITYPTPSTN